MMQSFIDHEFVLADGFRSRHNFITYPEKKNKQTRPISEFAGLR